MVDTPGFGDDLGREETTIDELVDVLKNKVKFVHTFVIAFNGESPRLTLRQDNRVRMSFVLFAFSSFIRNDLPKERHLCT